MRGYLFLNRTALFSNLFFALMLGMKTYQSYTPLMVLEFIIALSLFSVPVNLVTNGWSFLLLIRKVSLIRKVPVWLPAANFLMLLVQVFHLYHLRLKG